MRFFAACFLICVLCAPLGSLAQTATIADILAQGDKARADTHWDEALAAYGRVREMAAQSFDAKSDVAALVGMAAVEYQKANFDTADKLAHEALAISEKQGDPAGISAALTQVGNVQYRRGDFQASKQTVERVLAIRRASGDHAGIAVALNNLANASRQLGDKLQAIDYLVEAEREFATTGNENYRSAVLNNIGIGYSELGDYERALEYSWQSQAIAEKLGANTRLGNAYNNIANIETYRGNYRIALQIFQKALDADQKAQSPWEMAEATNNIGLLYQAQQNHEQAIACYLKTIEINRTVGDKSLDADAHRNLGTQMLALGRLDEAQAHLRQSLELARQISYPAIESGAHDGLGMVYFRLNRLPEAVAELEEAAKIQRATSDPSALAGTLADLAHVTLKSGRADEALRVARESAAMAASMDRPGTLWEAQLVSGLALRRMHRDDEAAREFEASIATIESLRARVAGPPTALPEYFGDKLEPYQERVEIALAAGKTEEALRFVEQSKSRALGDLLRSGRVSLDKSLSPPERESERRLETRLVALNLKIAKQPEAAEPKAEREKTRRDLDALQSRLYAAHPETAFERGVRPPMSAQEMAKLVTETGAVLLEYFVTPRNSYVFVLKAGARLRVLPLSLNEEALRTKSSAFHKQIAAHDLAYAATAQELYRQLLGPVQADLAGQNSAVIIPDGPLWDVPFHALQGPSKHFLIEDTAISYAPSLAVLDQADRMARKGSLSPAPRELLALGDPPGPDRLPEAERQVREIEKLYASSTSKILIGDAASEAALKAEAGQYRVLHLASHATLDDVNPMYSYALLAKSGIEDGLLEARELMQLNLKAEVLVLSACETARGHAAAGEGINGMLWAAFVAGAPTTVASLWRVESASTSELMIGFHRHWLAARGGKMNFAKAASLQAAAREMIAGGKYAHPFYWAGFVLVGSPN